MLSSVPANAYPYPPQPPDCQAIAAESFGEQCQACPYQQPERQCSYLAVALAVIMEHENRIDQNIDVVIPGFYNHAGIKAIIESDPMLNQDLLAGRAGLLQVDIRGVKVGNDDFGQQVGDAILREAGMRLLTEGMRSHTDLPPREQRRTWRAGDTDVGCRGNWSDELYILVRDVDIEGMSAMAERVRQRFSVGRAIEDARNNHLPIPGNVAFVHASQIPATERTSALATFERLCQLEAPGYKAGKAAQYREMLAFAASATAGEQPPEVLADQRLIYRHFLMACGPGIVQRLHQLSTADRIDGPA